MHTMPSSAHRLSLTVDGTPHTLDVDPRTSLLDLLREHLGVTSAGLRVGDDMHPVHKAFIDHDGLQCGYCTPGQICSAVGMLEEARAGHPSHVTEDLEAGLDGGAELTDEEIRERMSGNLCRCGAYTNIVAAIAEVAR
jgi:xanthine dehydrogenase YagT iron-sulfur-binding subunit